MSRLLHRLHRDERGMSLVFVGMGFMAFLAASTLAIDVGMFMTARTQAQTSADAAALAGAAALAKDDFNNRSISGPAVQNALSAAGQNTVMGRQVDVQPSDVTFPLSPLGVNNRVRVQVYRTAARGTCPGCSGAVTTLFGGMFGVGRVDISATATAEAAPTGSVQCAKPFIIPDRWLERTGPADTFDMLDNHNNPLANPDIYRPATAGSGYTGYTYRDVGQQMTLRPGTGSNIKPSFYFSWAIGGLTGGSEYDWNIANCNQTTVSIGDILLMEPGNKVGPTESGIDALIARDPNAHWDGRVVTNQHPSPREAIIPLYDPVYYVTGVMQGRTTDLKVANFLGFFIESRSGNTVYGRITPVSGVVNTGAPVPAGAFPTVIRLVE